MNTDSYDVKTSYLELQKKIAEACVRSGRRLEDVQLVAVSKYQPLEKIRALHQLGVHIFGESFLGEAQQKQETLSGEEIQWHYIGRLQSKKINKILQSFALIESVDSTELICSISEKAERLKVRAHVLLQVNIGEEETKAGFMPDEIESLTSAVLSAKAVEIRGLMCLPPLTEDEELKRSYFRRMKALLAHLRPKLEGEASFRFKELSMGTSHDYELAIEEGATLIRVGTRLFGERLGGTLQPGGR